MLQLHLIQAAQVTPFVSVLKESGAPVRKLGELVGLPIDAVQAGKGVVGEFCAWRFIDLAARHQQRELLGYNVAKQFPVHSVEGLGGYKVRHSETLKELLENFISDVQNESTGCHYRLVSGAECLWFDRKLMFGEYRTNWQTEQYMIAIIIQIVRLCAGPRWLPPEIRACSSRQALQIPVEWKEINFKWGSRNTQIMLPEDVLQLPLVDRPAETADDNEYVKPDTPLTFTELVRTQIKTNTIGLENAAKQTGLSPKTLKRKLQQENSSYSSTLDQLRFEMAISRLKNSDITIHAISRALGYEHQSNFTRAFKKKHGITPLEYRSRFRSRRVIPPNP